MRLVADKLLYRPVTESRLIPMRNLNGIILRNKTVSWLVMAAILVLAVIPVHLHFHHESSGTAESHKVDLHVETGSADHPHHDDTHILKASPDTLAKKFDGAAKSLVPIALLFFLLPVIRARNVAVRCAVPILSRHSYHHLIPHLRAPPRH